MSVRQLKINGVAVPVYAMLNISQQYTPLQAVYRARTAGGSLVQRTLWDSKLRTVVTGSGVIPPGISDIDYSSSFTLSCVAPRSLVSASANITIPAARRTDAGSTPYGRALTGDTWESTPVTMNGNVAELTPVSGATQYQVVYFPELTVIADPATEDHPSHGPVYGWTLTAEEV